MSNFPAVVRGSNSIRSYRSTSDRRTAICMHTNGISASILDVRTPHCNAPWVPPLTLLLIPVFGENG